MSGLTRWVRRCGPLRVVAVFVAVTVAFGGCDRGSDESSGDRTTTPQVGAPTGVVDDGVAAPTTIFDDAARMECFPSTPPTSPASFTGDGTYAVFVKGFSASEHGVGGRAQIAFDVFQRFSGEDARRAYAEDNPESRDRDDGPPNDYHTRNESTRVREATVAHDAEFWTLYTSEGFLHRFEKVSSEVYAAKITPTFVEHRVHTWLTVEDGEVTEICEQYRP